MSILSHIHSEVLSTIREDGGLTGIAYYRIHSKNYEKLPQNESSKLWREIFEEIERKEGLSTPCVLMKDDPFISETPFDKTDSEIRADRKYRQNHWKSNKCLDLTTANYMFGFYEMVLKDFANIDRIPLSV